MKIKYALDSNVFRNIGFINYIKQKKDKFEFFLPTLVQFETGFYFLNKGVKWDDFKKEISKFNGVFLNWDSIIIPDVLNIALLNKDILPFKVHFRDYVIGTQCLSAKINLITYNQKHFNWLKGVAIISPEQFILESEKRSN